MPKVYKKKSRKPFRCLYCQPWVIFTLVSVFLCWLYIVKYLSGSSLLCKCYYSKSIPKVCCVNVITQSLYQKSKDEKMLSQTEKNFGYTKVTSAMLISHFRGLLIVFLRKIKCNEESADSVLEFSTEIYIFIKHPQKLRFFIFFDK